LTPTPAPQTGIRAADLIDTTPPEIAQLEDPDQRRLAQMVYEDVTASVENAQLAVIQPVRWPSASLLGCPMTTSDDDVPGYRILMTAGDIVFEYHTDTGENVRFCRQTPIAEAEDDLLVLIDPIAGDMLALAQRRLAAEFDIAQRRVQLVEMRSVVWPDSSLGCATDQVPSQQIPTEGYRLVVSVADEAYIFHTNFVDMIRCAPEDEVLPTLETEPPPEATLAL